MNFSVEIGSRVYRIDLENPLDISIPLDFHGAQPNAFGVRRASARAYETGDLIGDTRRGGSCNFEEYTFIPHCNGTHTESVGHITDERISVRDCLQDAFVPAALVSVEPLDAARTKETYSVELAPEDRLITAEVLRAALENVAGDEWRAALIVRTVPNDREKKRRRYAENAGAFFSIEAMRYINEINVRHLLADVPSIDRAADAGKLVNHRLFWNVAPGSRAPSAASHRSKTITELIYAADEIEDGAYLLNLQIAPFAADAAPSRPLLFTVSAI